MKKNNSFDIEILKKAARQLIDAYHEALSDTSGKNRGRLAIDIFQLERFLIQDRVKYFSEAGQDKYVDSLLKEKRNGVFIDIGGYNGWTSSNTLFFEIFRGWNGLLIEPVRTNYDEAKIIRNCKCLNVCVDRFERIINFIEIKKGYTQMSGILENIEETALKNIRKNPNHEEKIYEIETKTLENILLQNNISQIDYISMDIEGGENDILETFPFDKFNVKVWSIENNSNDKNIKELMTLNNYKFVEYIGVDEIWIKN